MLHSSNASILIEGQQQVIFRQLANSFISGGVEQGTANSRLSRMANERQQFKARHSYQDKKAPEEPFMNLLERFIASCNPNKAKHAGTE